MYYIIFWSIIFSISSAAIAVLLGDRNLLAGNLLNFQKLISIIFDIRFVAAIILSFIARYSFMLVNSYLLKVPNLASNSTSITVFITLVSVIFMVIGNYFFLGEKLSFHQWIGAAVIMIGVWITLK